MLSPVETVIVAAWVFTAPALSATWRVKLNVPVWVGVPVTAPFAPMQRPGGREPRNDRPGVGGAARRQDSE